MTLRACMRASPILMTALLLTSARSTSGQTGELQMTPRDGPLTMEASDEGDPRQTGACCVECECVATTTCDECTAMGGWWYEGEDCFGNPPFECPCASALWHNGEPDFNNGVACDRWVPGPLESWVVDDVTFTEDVIVRDLHWWAAAPDSYDWQNTDDIIILADAGGMPGEVVYEAFDVYNTRYDTCRDVFSRNIYFYSIEGLEIPLEAGTYWFGMRPVNQTGGDVSYWLTSAAGNEVAQEIYVKSDYFGYPDWTPGHDAVGDYYDVAFCVTGDYDEPLGACCLEGECVATTTFDECNAAGGFWYEGQDCFGEPLFECPCTDDSLWDNGEPDYSNGMACDRQAGGPLDAWIVDDVTFDEDVIVRDLHWWAASQEGYNWQNTDDIIILKNDGPGGGPGTLVLELFDVYNTRIYMGPANPWLVPQYFYSIEGLEIPLEAGTYWFGMRPVNQGVNGMNYWLTSDAGASVVQECYFKSDYFGYFDWTSSTDVWAVAYDMAFCVTGDSDIPPMGACCVECECVATTTCQECIDMGGWWFEGEDCFGEPPFECPCDGAIWHNGEPDWRNGLLCEYWVPGILDAWVVDDITFRRSVKIQELHWWAVTDPEFNFQNTGQVNIYYDANGQPGNALYDSLISYPCTRYDTCRDAWGRTVYFYTLHDLDLELPAGTFWIGMRPVNQSEGGHNFNLTSAPNGTYQCYYKCEYYGYPDWTSSTEAFGEAYDLAFCVKGEVIDDSFYIFMDEWGNPLEFGGSGYNGGMWYYYPNTGWWNIWFYDDPFDWERWKEIVVAFDIWPLNNDMPWEVEVVLNWSLPPWSELELDHPPLPDDVVDPVLEDLYICRSETVFFDDGPGGNYYVIYPRILPWYNPEWVSVDVRGYNFAIEFGELYHECKPDPPYKPGDLDFDGHNVNTADLLILLGAWGTCGGDCDGDCDTDTGDLLILLGNWGVY